MMACNAAAAVAAPAECTRERHFGLDAAGAAHCQQPIPTSKTASPSRRWACSRDTPEPCETAGRGFGPVHPTTVGETSGRGFGPVHPTTVGETSGRGSGPVPPYPQPAAPAVSAPATCWRRGPAAIGGIRAPTAALRGALWPTIALACARRVPFRARPPSDAYAPTGPRPPDHRHYAVRGRAAQRAGKGVMATKPGGSGPAMPMRLRCSRRSPALPAAGAPSRAPPLAWTSSGAARSCRPAAGAPRRAPPPRRPKWWPLDEDHRHTPPPYLPGRGRRRRRRRHVRRLARNGLHGRAARRAVPRPDPGARRACRPCLIRADRTMDLLRTAVT